MTLMALELEPWLHLAHVAGAIVWVGGGVMLSLIGFRAWRSGDVALIREFARTLSYVGLRLLTPAVVVVLVSGVWLVLASAEWSLTQLWVLLALGAFVVAFLVGAVYLSRSALQLERTAAQGQPGSPDQGQDAGLEPARDALGRWLVGYGVVLAILAFAVWDMIFKPGA
jgi:uncharacterized membrane protein